MSGLQRICKLYGRMKCGDTMMVWDYANDVAVPEAEMPKGSPRLKASEKARLKNHAAGESLSVPPAVRKTGAEPMGS